MYHTVRRIFYNIIRRQCPVLTTSFYCFLYKRAISFKSDISQILIYMFPPFKQKLRNRRFKIDEYVGTQIYGISYQTTWCKFFIANLTIINRALKYPASNYPNSSSQCSHEIIVLPPTFKQTFSILL
jgi:hypothetical protein